MLRCRWKVVLWLFGALTNDLMPLQRWKGTARGYRYFGEYDATANIKERRLNANPLLHILHIIKHACGVDHASPITPMHTHCVCADDSPYCNPPDGHNTIEHAGPSSEAEISTSFSPACNCQFVLQHRALPVFSHRPSLLCPPLYARPIISSRGSQLTCI